MISWTGLHHLEDIIFRITGKLFHSASSNHGVIILNRSNNSYISIETSWWQLVKVSNVFNTLALKQILWKTKIFFKKLECRFLIEATKIENTPFSFKKANVKSNRLANTKWTYHKEWCFASNYLIFLENLFQF